MPTTVRKKLERESALRRPDTEIVTGTTADVRSPDPVDMFRPSDLHNRPLDWDAIGWLVLMHAGCLAAPFYFSWQALAVCVVMHWMTTSLGVCLGYHRYLSHRSFNLKKPTEFFVLLCGVLSGEGSPLQWASSHRLHHARSDKTGDPHSPVHGKWWSHMLWVLPIRPTEHAEALYRKFAPELVDRPLIRFFEKTFRFWPPMCAIALYALGGLPFVLWGLCMRMTLSYHSIWLINSATHRFGYRNYETCDESRNLWWVAILSYGEGWHNNHHAFPRIAATGHRWWEIDPTWWTIKCLQLSGQATEICATITHGHQQPEG